MSCWVGFGVGAGIEVWVWGWGVGVGARDGFEVGFWFGV